MEALTVLGSSYMFLIATRAAWGRDHDHIMICTTGERDLVSMQLQTGLGQMNIQHLLPTKSKTARLSLLVWVLAVEVFMWGPMLPWHTQHTQSWLSSPCTCPNLCPQCILHCLAYPVLCFACLVLSLACLVLYDMLAAACISSCST